MCEDKVREISDKTNALQRTRNELNDLRVDLKNEKMRLHEMEDEMESKDLTIDNLRVTLQDLVKQSRPVT